MKILKKSILVVGAMVLTLSLFSFKPANSNEVNAGETIAYETTMNFETTQPQESAKVLKAVGKFVKNAANKVKAAIREVTRVQFPEPTVFIVKSADELDALILTQDTDYRLSRL